MATYKTNVNLNTSWRDNYVSDVVKSKALEREGLENKLNASICDYWHARNGEPTNQGLLSAEEYREKIRNSAKKQTLAIYDSKKKKMFDVPVRVPYQGEAVHVDALNFVVGLSSFDDNDSTNEESYLNTVFCSNEVEQSAKDNLADNLAFVIANIIGAIFGEPFSNLNKNVKGLHGYKYQYTIGDPDYILGKVCFGGNNGTVLFMITGKGCYEASCGWEYSLYRYLDEQEQARITRIDLALDDFEGDFSSAEQADQADTDNKFSLTNRQPSVQHLGDWKRHQGLGRTLQVGKRENGKMFRGYEKGKQLGDCESLWFRSEIEFKSKDRVLPLEMLLKPTDYFAGAYPYALELVEKKTASYANVSVIRVKKKESEITLNKAIEVFRNQFGRYAKTLRDLIPDIDDKSKDTIILDLIETKKERNYVPKRLKVSDSYLRDLRLNGVINTEFVDAVGF